MLRAFDSTRMRAMESAIVARGEATLDVLMERAGTALAEGVSRRVPQGKIAAVCGPGNNGGDGWVAARVLHVHGRDVTVFALKSPDELSGPARAAASAAVSAGVAWAPFEGGPLPNGLAGVIDAVFGFGFHGRASGAFSEAIEAISASGATVVAADVPSGIDADTGAVDGQAVHADLTVTFTAPKQGLYIFPGAGNVGDLSVADIGVPLDMAEAGDALEVPSVSDLRPLFPVPQPTDHKGSRGRVAVVAGSLKYPGAAVLAAIGALRMGPGFVVAVVPEPIADVLRLASPSLLVRPVPADGAGAFSGVAAVMDAVADADAVVTGPGLTTGGDVPALVRALIETVQVPLVLDADALNVPGVLDWLDARTAPTVITPHPGEAARLLGSSVAEVQSDRVRACASLARPGRACLLKAPHSLVAVEGRTGLALAGNAGLARAGSGDVLAGMIGTLLAQGLAPYDAAMLGAYLHGRAAEAGTRVLTETCFTSADIVTFLPEAVRELVGG